MMRRSIVMLVVAALSVAASPVLAVNSEKPTILSINLCTDQMVMLLADTEQVSALSRLSRDEAGSYFHEKAEQFPQAEPQAEDIVPRSPDIVITGPYSHRHTLALLDELGVRVESLELAESVEAMLSNIRRVGRILNQSSRAENVIADLQRRLAIVDQRVAVLDAAQRSAGLATPRAAVYDANGYTVGGNSLRGEAMRLGGWHNVAIDAGIESYGVLSLEDMIQLAPQALIESPYSQGTYSRGQMLPHHPALRQVGLAPMVISLPSNQTICAGPWLVDIIETLLDARERFHAQAS